jgi:hypothetical protein
MNPVFEGVGRGVLIVENHLNFIFFLALDDERERS